MEPLLINPPAAELGRVNSILTGKSCRYAVSEFPGPLSVKSVIEGEAIWRTARSRHRVGPGTALVINHGEPYSMEIDSRSPVETFCLFFRAGFVEDAAHVARNSTEALLNDPWGTRPVEFPSGSALFSAVAACRTDPENGLFAVAEVLSGLRRVRAARPSTRDELLKRVLRGRDYIEDNLAGSLRLTDTARIACLSPFHFHRTFRAVFGEAPHEYAKRRRLQLAYRVIADTDEPITSVALRSGFETPSAFATAFRKQYGFAPTEIRKNGKAPAAKFARG